MKLDLIKLTDAFELTDAELKELNRLLDKKIKKARFDGKLVTK